MSPGKFGVEGAVIIEGVKGEAVSKDAAGLGIGGGTDWISGGGVDG